MTPNTWTVYLHTQMISFYFIILQNCFLFLLKTQLIVSDLSKYNHAQSQTLPHNLKTTPFFIHFRN